MGRLTIEKDVKEMSMYELTHNSCYVKDGLARYRDFETDIDCRDLARKLMVDYGLWKGIPEHGLDADNELVDDDIFDESILENLWYGLDTLEGLIALFYRNLWAMADLRTILKKYEDMEEQGKLVEVVRCKDCEHYDTLNCGEGAGWCKVFNAGRFDDWYCSSAKLKEPKVGEWIPCSERLPENHETVIFTTKEGTVEAGWYDAEKNWCVNEGYFPSAFQIITWMPLPEPYKEEGAGNEE